MGSEEMRADNFLIHVAVKGEASVVARGEKGVQSCLGVFFKWKRLELV